MLSQIITVAVFVFQTLSVFACNSRIFGLIPEGRGWYTNVELAERYTSMVTPIGWTFSIWGIIYTWEIALVVYVFVGDDISVWEDTEVLVCWVAANVFQALWAPLFATERLFWASIALSGISVSLTLLGHKLQSLSGVSYALVSVPVWVHAGWTLAAALVNWNLTVQQAQCLRSSTESVPTTLLAAAFGTLFIATGAGGTLLLVEGPMALPLAVSLLWALLGIYSNLGVKSQSEGAKQLERELRISALQLGTPSPELNANLAEDTQLLAPIGSPAIYTVIYSALRMCAIFCMSVVAVASLASLVFFLTE